MTRSKTGWILLGLSFVLTLVGVTPTIYADEGDQTLIHACLNKKTGEIRIIRAHESCKHNETELDLPGISAPVGKGSIMVLSGRVFTIGRCVTVGSTCAYRSPRDGTIQNMRVLIDSNQYMGPTVLALHVNGSQTLLSTSIPAGSTSDIDIPGMVDILDGDRISIELDNSEVPMESALTALI